MRRLARRSAAVVSGDQTSPNVLFAPKALAPWVILCETVPGVGGGGAIPASSAAGNYAPETPLRRAYGAKMEVAFESVAMR